MLSLFSLHQLSVQAVTEVVITDSGEGKSEDGDDFHSLGELAEETLEGTEGAKVARGGGTRGSTANEVLQWGTDVGEGAMYDEVVVFVGRVRSPMN
ncbi:hypothetical protein E2542_SST17829 [Spatholobus suberectus]|nr:hypothetical protein E2542_SST17829 [Spatholobus suberectus]